MVKGAIPDLTFIPEKEIMVGEGDMVATRGKTIGHHSGTPLFGVEPSGKELIWYGIDISRFHNAQIVERWVCADILGLFNQMGVGR
jgi:predicted ester cyclase